MSEFRSVDPRSLGENVFSLIGDRWMLVTATAEGGAFNTMTASWGGLGVLWGRPVAFVFIRPQRYTDEFAVSGDRISLSFFGEEQRKALAFCGANSGREVDKISETGLTPVAGEHGEVWFNEAKLVLLGRKLYADRLRPSAFTDPAPLENYKAGDYHNVYVYEITGAMER